jgi:hypothetical protein
MQTGLPPDLGGPLEFPWQSGTRIRHAKVRIESSEMPGNVHSSLSDCLGNYV